MASFVPHGPVIHLSTLRMYENVGCGLRSKHYSFFFFPPCLLALLGSIIAAATEIYMPSASSRSLALSHGGGLSSGGH